MASLNDLMDEAISALVHEWGRFNAEEPREEDQVDFEEKMHLGELVQIAALLPEDLGSALWTFAIRLEEFQTARDQKALMDAQAGSAAVM